MAFASPESWPFVPYEKIAESLSHIVGDDESRARALTKVSWIVVEKIHGANYSLVSDGRDVRAAKRKSFLDPDDDFFGHASVRAKLAPKVQALASLIRARHPQTTLVYVFGELFGGRYPHPDFPEEGSVSPVQTGVWYCPTLAFCAFDIAVVSNEVEGRRYLDFDEAQALSGQVDLPWNRPLFRGPLDEALAYPLGEDSIVPAWLGLPPLPFPNKAEGVVLRPERSLVLGPGLPPFRPLLKRKIAEFAEDIRYHGAKKPSAPSKSLPGALTALEQLASSLVNENRIQSAVSKLGRVTPKDRERRSRLVTLVVEDVRESLAETQGALLDGLRPEEHRELMHYIEEEVLAILDLVIA